MHSQSRVFGTVTDLDEGNTALPLAKVTLKATGASVHTNAEGAFVLNDVMEGKHIISVSFTGYETQEFEVLVKAKRAAEVNPVMQKTSVSLDDLALVLAMASQEETQDQITAPIIN